MFYMSVCGEQEACGGTLLLRLAAYCIQQNGTYCRANYHNHWEETAKYVTDDFHALIIINLDKTQWNTTDCVPSVNAFIRVGNPVLLYSWLEVDVR